MVVKVRIWLVGRDDFCSWWCLFLGFQKNWTIPFYDPYPFHDTCNTEVCLGFTPGMYNHLWGVILFPGVGSTVSIFRLWRSKNVLLVF
jgi:hypothetical protein